mgnify:CR=1 FL=1
MTFARGESDAARGQKDMYEMTSRHPVYKTPWPGDPRVNIQEGKAGKAKAYQVKQVLAAIARLRGE